MFSFDKVVYCFHAHNANLIGSKGCGRLIHSGGVYFVGARACVCGGGDLSSETVSSPEINGDTCRLKHTYTFILLHSSLSFAIGWP